MAKYYGKVREIFFEFGDRSTTAAAYGYKNIGGTADVATTFRVPDDFKSLVSIELLVSYTADGTDQDIDINSAYGKEGESIVLSTEADTTSVYSYSTNIHTAIDLSGIVTGIEAGDVVGINYGPNAISASTRAYGIKFIYNGA